MPDSPDDPFGRREDFMRVSQRAVYLAAGIAVAALGSVPAVADHGKAGLWNITVSMNMAGMPDMSKLPPEAQAAMRAHGMSMNGHSMTVQHCMTPEEVKNDHPHMRNEQACKMSNVKTGAGLFSADLSCSGEMQGAGHVEFVFDSPEHYSGKQSMTGTSQGHSIDETTSFDAHWVGADCKGLTH
jgi:hypothetical protein